MQLSSKVLFFFPAPTTPSLQAPSTYFYFQLCYFLSHFSDGLRVFSIFNLRHHQIFFTLKSINMRKCEQFSLYQIIEFIFFQLHYRSLSIGIPIPPPSHNINLRLLTFDSRLLRRRSLSLTLLFNSLIIVTSSSICSCSFSFSSSMRLI